ncbi:MAG TPA: cytochrome c [Polyangiaceae bacterium]|nr:cytochrome c [Polyangiaceae bacterium]
MAALGCSDPDSAGGDGASGGSGNLAGGGSSGLGGTASPSVGGGAGSTSSGGGGSTVGGASSSTGGTVGVGGSQAGQSGTAASAGGPTNGGSGGASGGAGGGTSGSAGAGMAGAGMGGVGGAGTAGSAGASSGGTNTGGGSGGGLTSAAYAPCAVCHGAKGEGVAMLGPEIQHPVRDYATWVIRNGRSGHPSFSKSVMPANNATMLPDAALNGMLDALAALPKPTTGEALYKDYCANCHGDKGTNGPAAHSAKATTAITTMHVRSGHNLTQYSMRAKYMPKWMSSELSDAEIGSISTYLNSL